MAGFLIDEDKAEMKETRGKKRRAGRPSKLTPEIIREAADMVRGDNSFKIVCRLCRTAEPGYGSARVRGGGGESFDRGAG